MPHLPGGAGLLFSDIPADTIHCWRPGRPTEVWRRPSGHSNGMTLDRQGRLLCCEHHRRRLTRTAWQGNQAYGEEPVVLAARHGGRRLNSPNDVVVRSDGTIYFTDPTYGLRDDYGSAAHEHEEQERRRIYRVPAATAAALPDVPDAWGPEMPPEPLAAGAGPEQPNGLVLSPDERVLYVGDSGAAALHAFDVEPDGALGAGRLLHRFDRTAGRGNPDGMRADAQGRLWCTGPGGLWLLSPEARPLAHVAFPEVTANCAFAEEDGCALLVTASTSLYRLRLQVPGVPGRA